MKKYYVFHYRSTSISSYMLHDFVDDNRFVVRTNMHDKQPGIIAILQKIIFSSRFNKIISMPGKRLFDKWLILNTLDIENSRDTTLVFTNEAFKDIHPESLKRWLHENDRVNVVCILIDPIDSPYPSSIVAKDIINSLNFQNIITFDWKDAEKYGYKHSMCLYSQYPILPQSIENDLYYIGASKGRIRLLNDILDCAVTRGVLYDFTITGVKKEDRKFPNVRYNTIVPYKTVVNQLQLSNCILEIMQEGQTGVTLRYYEAISYNKKLLTNNLQVKKLKYYDPRYIQVFSSVDDIDWEWVKSRDVVEFGYANDYSPINLVREGLL